MGVVQNAVPSHRVSVSDRSLLRSDIDASPLVRDKLGRSAYLNQAYLLNGSGSLDYPNFSNAPRQSPASFNTAVLGPSSSISPGLIKKMRFRAIREVHTDPHRAILGMPKQKSISSNIPSPSFLSHYVIGSTVQRGSQAALPVPGTSQYAPLVTPGILAFIKLLNEKVARARLDPDDRNLAQVAKRDAVLFFRRLGARFNPVLSVADDGVINVHWRGKRRGVLIVFTGDGTATFSILKPSGSYTRNIREVSVSAAIPRDLLQAINVSQGEYDELPV